MKKRIISMFLVLSLMFIMATAVSASGDETQIEAQTLYDLGLSSGTGTDSAGNPIFSLDEVPTRDTYLKRVLTDDQLSALKNADKETLRLFISTISDAVAYLDQFNATFWTGTGANNLSIDHVLSVIRGQGNADAGLYTGFVGWCLGDDYPSAQFVSVFTGNDDREAHMFTAIVLPIQNGYFIFSPAQLSTRGGSSSRLATLLAEAEVATLENLQNVLVTREAYSGESTLAVFLANVNQDLQFRWLGAELIYGNAQKVYTISEEEKIKLIAQKRDARWVTLMNNWSSYGMPENYKPTMTRDQIEELIGKDIDTVAAAVKNVGDCVAYLCLSLFEASGGDIQFKVGNTDLSWHFNYSPQATFAYNWGCCGSTSGLVAYLLEDDYDTTGIIGITFAKGEGGGHVINYIKDGDRYYMFDMINLISSNFRAGGFNFVGDSTLQEASKKWSDRTRWNEKLMWAYQAFDGDAPVGWDNSCVSYLPSGYQDTAIILMEHPDEGYVYQWVDINHYVQMAITGLRNIY